MNGSNFEFSKDWFSRHVKNWETLFRTVRWQADAPKTVVEIGSFEGRSTVWLLQNALQNNQSRIYCVDTWTGGVEHTGIAFDSVEGRFDRNIEKTGRASLVQKCKGSSFDQLTGLYIEGIKADFVYIDGSHQAKDVLSDLVLGFELAKSGALILCDDYVWQGEQTPEMDILNNPKIAIDAFININRRRLDLVHGMPLVQLAFIKR